MKLKIFNKIKKQKEIIENQKKLDYENKSKRIIEEEKSIKIIFEKKLII